MNEGFLVIRKNRFKSNSEIICFDGSVVEFGIGVFSSDTFEMLSRYAVEKVCGFKGQITQVADTSGFDFIEFNQAYLQSELVMSALKQEELVRNQDLSYFIINLKILCGAVRIPFFGMRAEQIRALRNQIKELLNQWEATPEGHRLKLPIQKPIDLWDKGGVT